MQTLFDAVLKCDIFSFHTQIYQQIQGTVMGTKMVPSYANNLMDSLERQFLECEPLQSALWKWYIDEIFCVWSGSKGSLEVLLCRLNSCHPTICFTWTISTESVEFLDIQIYKGSRFRETGILGVQTHFKPTNTFQYLQNNYERTISTFRYHLLCRGHPRCFVDPLLSTVPYSLRNNCIQPPSTPNLNLSSNPNTSLPTNPSKLNPINNSIYIPLQCSAHYLYELFHWEHLRFLTWEGRLESSM